MNRNLAIIGGAILIIALLGIGAFTLMSKNSKKGDMTPVDGIEAQNNENVGASKASIKSLMGAGKNVTCQIKYPENGGSGTIFVSDKKFRGDFMMSVGGNNSESHMISDGEYMYSWQGTKGMKFKADAAASPSTATGQTQNQTADINSEVDMDCGSWSVDSSKFTPPSDVTFTDYSEMMMKMQSTQGSGAPKMDSSACNSITDASAKAACMSAVGQ